VYGANDAGYFGVIGAGDTGVFGTGKTYGVLGYGSSGPGVYGHAGDANDGVQGQSDASGNTGSLGGVTSGVAGFCFSDTLDNFGAGVAGYGEADNVAGVLAENVAGGWALRVIGPACSTDGWSQCSDIRYKTNVAPLENALEKALRLRGVSFDWKRDTGAARGFRAGRQIGFIAQEVEKVLPELVSADNHGCKSVAYANVVPVLAEAIKTQEQRLQAVEAENALLKSECAELRARLIRLDMLEARYARIKAWMETLAARRIVQERP
jgi:hypothetical protein